MSIIRTIAEAKADIKAFIKNNPEAVINEFSDLHDYYDANCYVQHCVNEYSMDYDKANEIVDVLDNWIKHEI